MRDVLERAGGASVYADLRLALVERSSATGPRQRIPIDLYRMLVEKDDTPNIVLQNGDVFTLPIVEDKIFILGEVKAPGPQDFRPDLTPRSTSRSPGALRTARGWSTRWSRSATAKPT